MSFDMYNLIDKNIWDLKKIFCCDKFYYFIDDKLIMFIVTSINFRCSDHSFAKVNSNSIYMILNYN